MPLKSYLITDPKYYGSKKYIFVKKFKIAYLEHKPDFVCFRDKLSPDFLGLVEAFNECICALNIKNSFINGDYQTALKFGFRGVHLRGDMINKIVDAKKEKLEVIYSAHSLKDIQKAIDFGANYVTFSPIFKAENKGCPKGVEVLKEAVSLYGDSIKIFALGGIISHEQVEMLDGSGVFGFASIRYFV